MNTRKRSLAAGLVGILVLALPVFTAAQNTKGPGRKSGKTTAKRKSTPPKPIPELQIYPLGPDEFRALETQEMIALARHLYEPDPRETVLIEAEINRIQDERWESNEKISEFKAMLAERSRLFQEITAAISPDEPPRKKLRQVQRNKDFAKVLSNMRKYERKQGHRFTNYAEQIESVLDPTKVEAARREWKNRVKKSRETNQLRELLQGLRHRRWRSKTSPQKSPAKKDADKIKSKSEAGKSKAPSKPRNAKKKPSKPRSDRGTGPIKPLSEWEAYVRDFIRDYELTPTQSNAALSILRDIQSRAAQVEKRNKGKIAAAQKITDAKLRKQRLAELDEPMQQLFRELCRRLDRLLTGAQRSKGAKK
ncbi:MAG: hypothetical protein MI923_15900 [Phycisphaerales bacterium]|nr:hypothetical protein [Phycisphaerales bacterium]